MPKKKKDGFSLWEHTICFIKKAGFSTKKNPAFVHYAGRKTT
jgi:hypothetical protein